MGTENPSTCRRFSIVNVGRALVRWRSTYEANVATWTLTTTWSGVIAFNKAVAGVVGFDANGHLPARSIARKAEATLGAEFAVTGGPGAAGGGICQTREVADYIESEPAAATGVVGAAATGAGGAFLGIARGASRSGRCGGSGGAATGAGS